MAMAADPVKLARALAGAPGLAGVAPEQIAPLPQKGLAHAHFRLGGTGWLLRVPRAPSGDARARLHYQAECFRRVAPCGRGPTLHAVIDPCEDLPAGALVVEDIGGHPPRLPTELSLIAEALAAVHAVPLPAPEQRPPLPDPADPFSETLAAVERNASFLEAAGVSAQAADQIEAEIAWARAYAAGHRAGLPAAPRTLVLTDTHPGNFIIVATGLAKFVDLEKAAYGQPAIDLAHATLRPSTQWDPDCGAILSRDDVARFHRAYFMAAGPEAEAAIRPWLLPMRRLTWLRTTTVFARFRAERAAETLSAEAARHAARVIESALAAETIADIRREWLGPDAMEF